MYRMYRGGERRGRDERSVSEGSDRVYDVYEVTGVSLRHGYKCTVNPYDTVRT